VNPYVFVVGCPRSGTTLLGRLLDAHPELAVIHEGRFVTDFYEQRRGLTADDGVTPALVDELLAFRPFSKGVDVEREALERLAAEPIGYAEFVSAVFDLHGRAHGKRLVGDKTPYYVRSLRTLHALWPAARVVHIIRDGRDVCLSVRNWRKVAVRGGSVARLSGWEADPVSTIALWWEWQVRLGREDGATLGPSLYREVSYEALVADPARECEALCEFLGLPYDERMLGFHEGRRRDEPGLDAKQAWRPVTSGLRNWRTDLEPAEIDRFEAAAGGLLDELGYPLGAPDGPSEAVVAAAAQARRTFSEDMDRRPHRRLPTSWRR
jgi:Sulfotransferase family